MIENISDQLGLYMGEITNEVLKLAKENNITVDQSIKIAEIATKDIKADAIHHINFTLNDLCEAIEGLQDLNIKIEKED